MLKATDDTGHARRTGSRTSMRTCPTAACADATVEKPTLTTRASPTGTTNERPIPSIEGSNCLRHAAGDVHSCRRECKASYLEIPDVAVLFTLFARNGKSRETARLSNDQSAEVASTGRHTLVSRVRNPLPSGRIAGWVVRAVEPCLAALRGGRRPSSAADS